jgi:iron complex transport system substrate-binding protein
MRIVSLVPGRADILCALGLDADVVGISHECDVTGLEHAVRLTRSALPLDRLSSAEIDAA